MKKPFGSLLAILLSMGPTVFAQSVDGRLTGTWDAVVTIRNCVRGGGGSAIRSFESVGSFNAGGTFSGITSGTPPTLRTSERGVWTHLSGDSYRFRFKAYLYSADALVIGYQVVTHDLQLDADNLHYTSDGITQIFSPDGTQIGLGCSTSEATRMVLD